jgi:hypothetical protein
MSTSAERTVRIPEERRIVTVFSKPTSADRVVYANED